MGRAASEGNAMIVRMLTIALATTGAVAVATSVTPRSGVQDAVVAKPEEEKQVVVVVVGAAGTEEYGKSFVEWAARWESAAKRGSAAVTVVGTTKQAESDRSILQRAIKATPRNGRLWLVLIGHGTFDQRSARFNMKGPDVSATELAEWLDELKRPTAIINCASASAPFINRCSGKGRVVLTATKSGAEMNYARFGDYLSQVIGDPGVDLDKDGQTSLLEAWLIAARRTQDFYTENGRLSTEHALIDDNADQRGTRYDAFKGIRATAAKGGEPDGQAAHGWHLVPAEFERRMPANLAEQRDQIEDAIRRLRANRSNLREDEYYEQLEELLVPLATIYEEAGAETSKP